MRAVLRLAAHELRARWLGWAILALLAGLAGGAVLTAAAGARRTASAYPRFLQVYRGSDVLFSPAGSGLGGYDDALAKLPGVAAIAPLAGLNALLAGPGGALHEQAVVAAPLDRRYGHLLDVPKLLAGRQPLPDHPAEVMVDQTAAQDLHLRVGSVVTCHAVTALSNSRGAITPRDAVGWRPAGIAYASGIADNAANGYALCLRPFWIVEGWLSGPIQVSREFGKRSGWPGGTSGISMQPMARSGREQDSSGLIVSRASASQRATGPAPLAHRRARFPFGGGRRPPDPPGSPTKANRHEKLEGAPDSERRSEILACSADSRCVISLDLGAACTPAVLGDNPVIRLIVPRRARTTDRLAAAGKQASAYSAFAGAGWLRG